MKSALYMGQKSIKMADAPMPVCGENDVLLKNIYASQNPERMQLFLAVVR